MCASVRVPVNLLTIFQWTIWRALQRKLWELADDGLCDVPKHDEDLLISVEHSEFM